MLSRLWPVAARTDVPDISLFLPKRLSNPKVRNNMSAPIQKPQEEEWIDPYPKKKRSFRWFTTGILLLALYVLSTGPATLLHRKGHISKATFKALYLPLVALAESSQPFDQFMSWYTILWIR